MRARVISFALLLISLPGVAAAAWPTTPAANGVRLAVIPNDFLQDGAMAVPDGAGGTICAFRDNQGTSLDDYPYLQRLDRAGNIQWGTSAILVNDVMGSYLDDHYLQLVPYAAGGAVLAYTHGPSGFPLLGNRFDLAGAPHWADPGRVLQAANSPYQHLLATPDGQGNTYLFWGQGNFPAAAGVQVQKVDSTGQQSWGTNGVNLFAGPVNDLDVATDGSGGYVVAFASGGSVRAQHMDASGNPLWAAGGVLISNLAGGFAQKVEIQRSSLGQYILAWSNAPSGGESDLFAQCLDASGNPLWLAGGKPICTAPGNQSMTWFQPGRCQLVPDNAGGAYLVWVDFRAGAAYPAIFGQHLASSGVFLWGTNGTAISPGRSNEAAVLAPDGLGGAIAFWADYRDSGGPATGVYAQHFTASSAADWAPGGVAIANQGGSGAPTTVVPGENGGVVVFWAGDGIRAQRVDVYGHVGEVDPLITSVQDVPGDQGGAVKLTWSATSLDTGPSNPIGGYLLWREVPQSSALRRIAAGASLASVGSAGDMPSAGAATLWTTTSATGATHYWEYVSTVSATGAASYQATVATTADSLPGSNPTTAFMVSANSASVPGQHWNSPAATGYSVDNLAPARPAPLTGEYAAGTAHLHWNRNTEPDLAGYRLYRGTDTSFTPGSGNLIASPPDTGYADVAGGSFVYKLTAIDVHGNESAANVLAPGGVTGVGDGVTPVLAFAPPAPNPARGGTIALRITLPRAMRAGVSVFAINGRRVVTLAPRAYGAGEQSVTLPLRDARGIALGAGVYVVQLETASGTITRRLAVLP